MSIKSIKRLCLSAALALSVGAAFAQKTPAPGTHITVSKVGGGMYTTIQAAVNAAQPGQVIEILDESVYEEQVTIDGREKNPWTGVTGGKSGITLRYVPSSSSVAIRPAIMWKDTRNQSPKTPAETQKAGDSIGQSGNFETNGALRIIRTTGITIESIIIDGGGSAPFAWDGVWCSNGGSLGPCYPLSHGNSAIAVVISGNVQIRDCEARNAYFGIYVKDRNVGGVFGNPNPSDIDVTVPLSGFGKTGNHLIEYNKIHDNDVGVFFESSWDLGSTVRYNLIYSNFHKTTTTKPAAADNWSAGAIMFKDTYLSPVAIYNNTFYDNTMNLIGDWQVGYQHLVFNNIFSKFHAVASTSANGFDVYKALEGMFPNRMKHNTFGGARDILFLPQRNDLCPEYQDSVFIQEVSFEGMGAINLPKITKTYELCYTLANGTVSRSTYPQQGFVIPGAILPGYSAGTTGGTFPTGANNRWLETAGYTGTGTGAYAGTLPMLFKSITPTSPDFLVPDWTRPEVKNFITNGGWPDGGIINEDGTVADLGAIPYSGKRPCDGVAQTSRARVFPSSVVVVNGTTATAGIYVNQEIGSLSGLTIKYLRWIIPIPNNGSISTYGESSFGNNGIVVPATSIRTITIPAGTTLTTGPNTVNFTVPALAAADTTGFFELVLEGKDGIGRTVTTDVGFLPFRRLDYFLYIDVMNGASVVPNPVVTAGTPVTLRVTAFKRGISGTANTPYNTGAPATPLGVEFSLLSHPSARMYDPNGNALTNDANLATGAQYTKTYTVYFTKAGDEVITAAGLWESGGTRLVFLGDLQLKVRPGAPDNIVFQDPIPKSQLGGAFPPSIGGSYPVVVGVRDKFDNPVDTKVTVNMASLQPDVGGVLAASASTDEETGEAKFTASVTNGKVGDIFNIVASSGALKPDTASFMVGRLPTPEGSPRVVSGGYVSDGGVIKSAAVTFDRNASHDWFSSVEFAFGAARGTLTNMACVAVGPADAKSATVDFGCAFPGTNIPDVLGNNSEITINFSGSFGWAPLTVTIVNGDVSVLTPSRNVPQVKPDEGAAVVAPVVILAGEFTAGPNPVPKRSGIVNFFRLGRQVTGGELRVYDATGNMVNKIKIIDNAVGAQGKRQVGSWDLRDRKGRLVSEGTYLVKGALKTRSGEKEKISLKLGVR